MAIDYPVRVSIPEPEQLSRWKVFFKWWLFVIPHWILLLFLWLGAFIAWIAAFFAILFTGKCPQSLFRYVVGVYRWGFRVQAYMFLLTDEYPPFSFTAEHPARFEVEYPERLSQGLVLVKWWLLVLPVVILFTGRPHLPLVRLVRGYLCWSARVYSYVFLLTDRYPPFSLEESESAAAEGPLPV